MSPNTTSSQIHPSFTALTPTTHLYSPIQSNLPPTLRLRSCSPSSSKSAPPSTIILCTSSTSTIASSSHLDRYLSGYTTTYPTSRILVLLSSSAQNKRRTTTAHEDQFAPAVDAIVAARRESNNNNKGHGQVLLHVFGEQGAALAAQLAWAYRLSTERPLEAKAILYDGAPTSEGVAKRVDIQRQRQGDNQRRSSSHDEASSGMLSFLIPGLQRRRVGSKNYDYNVVDGGESMPSIARAVQHCVAVLLQLLFAAYAYTFAIMSISADYASTVVRSSCTSSSRAVREKARKSLQDPELIAAGCRECHVQPEVGYMSCWDANEDLSVEAMDLAAVKQQQRRDSGFAYEVEDKDESSAREWRFGEVADDLFWEGVKGLWIS